MGLGWSASPRGAGVGFHPGVRYATPPVPAVLSLRTRRFNLLPCGLYSRRRPASKQADWDVLAGIIFVLRTGIPWEMLPQEI